MTRRELNLAIFEGTAKAVLWQPRLETWIGHHQQYGTLPERFKGMDNLQIYDALHCSIRYGASAGIEGIGTGEVTHAEESHSGHKFVKNRTPVGEICTVYREIWENGRCVNSRIEDYPVKTAEGLKVLTYLVDHQDFRANVEVFTNAANTIGIRGEPTIFLSSSGFTELIKEWCGLVDTFYLLQDHPAEIEEFLEACDRRDHRLIETAIKLPCRIFNLGDHATDEFTPPPILKKYLIQRWQRISKKLHSAGRFVHSHWDGNSKTILPYLKDSGLDAVEALTPAPMGNIALEEIKSAVGDKMVVLDLLPAIDFLSYRPLNELLDFTRRVIDMFAPRLILGVSDEISQVGEIEKIEAVSNLVDKICGLAE